jgi:hypothetical protein
MGAKCQGNTFLASMYGTDLFLGEDRKIFNQDIGGKIKGMSLEDRFRPKKKWGVGQNRFLFKFEARSLWVTDDSQLGRLKNLGLS